jgi:hypothetical protein
MRPDEDGGEARGLHPLNTVIRGLAEEIGLNTDLVKQSDITFLHLGLSARNWAYNLFCNIRLPTDLREVQQCMATRARDVEHRIDRAHGVNFDLDSFAKLIVAKSYARSPSEKESPIASWSKMGLLYAAVRKFGTDAVRSTLAGL